jgi:hypothetical protein
MQKIVNFTSKVIGAVNYRSLGCNIPVNSVMTVLGIDNELSFASLSDTLNSIQEIKGAIAQGYNMANCAWTLTDKNNALGFLEQLANGVLGAIGSVIDEIWNAISIQIYTAIGQVVGTFLNLVEAFQSLITSILLLADSILNFFTSLA